MRALALSLLIFLTACASPTMNMPPAQIATLSDDQLCTYNNTYGGEPKLLAEIQTRRLNCDPAFRSCIAQGVNPHSQYMNICINQVRENMRLQRDLEWAERDATFYHHSDPWRGGPCTIDRRGQRVCF